MHPSPATTTLPPGWNDEHCPAAVVKGAAQGLHFALSSPFSDVFLPEHGIGPEHSALLAALKLFDQQSDEGRFGRVAAWDALLAAGAAYFARLNEQVRPRLADLDAWYAAQAGGAA
jgi:hypothetical protein